MDGAQDFLDEKSDTFFTKENEYLSLAADWDAGV